MPRRADQEALVAQIIALGNKGNVSQRDIAKQTRCSVKFVNSTLKAARQEQGAQAPPPAPAPETEGEAFEVKDNTPNRGKVHKDNTPETPAKPAETPREQAPQAPQPKPSGNAHHVWRF